MTDPVKLGWLDRIVNVNFGGGWLLLNLNITGQNDKGDAPPFGAFTWKPLPKGLSEVNQQQVTHSQKTETLPNAFFFPWNTIVPVPDITNYRTIAPWTINHSLLFAWSVMDTIRGFPTDPAFPVPDKEFWYSTAAKAAAAAAILPSISSSGYFANFGDFLSDTFTLLPLRPDGTRGVPSFTVQSVSDPITAGTTIYTIKVLLSIPPMLSTIPVKFALPGLSSGQGWASVFTNQKGSINAPSDLKGNADQSVFLPPIGSTHTYTIKTTASPKKGTVIVDGVAGFTPGLTQDAPLGPKQ